jgi:phytoene/squalene synthetase
VNFWQDLSIDLPRGRCYVPQVDAERHGVAILRQASNSHATRSLVRDLCSWTRELMQHGEPLVHRIAGRFGWELRLVVQGGLRVLDKIEALDFNVMTKRPRLHASDAPVIAWRAFAMRQRHGAAVIVDGAIR